MAGRAARRRGTGPVAKAFFAALHNSLCTEETNEKRSIGDKQALVTCIKSAMEAASEVLGRKHALITRCDYRIPMPGFTRGKTPDYAFTKGKRFYLIEQKSIVRFQRVRRGVPTGGSLPTKKDGSRVRYAALFNYLHQPRAGFENVCVLDGTKIVDHIRILIPEYEYTAYSTQEVESLFGDISVEAVRVDGLPVARGGEGTPGM